MGFIWVQDISSSAVIDAVDAIEIRANVDTVDNEKCAAEKVTDQSTNYPSYCNDEHTGYLSGHKVGVDTSHYPSYCPGYYPSFLSDYCPAHLAYDYPVYCPSFNQAHFSGLLSFV